LPRPRIGLGLGVLIAHGGLCGFKARPVAREGIGLELPRRRRAPERRLLRLQGLDRVGVQLVDRLHDLFAGRERAADTQQGIPHGRGNPRRLVQGLLQPAVVRFKLGLLLLQPLLRDLVDIGGE
jgi:hypothetical protein